MAQDWYERRGELRPGMVFETGCHGRVKLDRGVPADATGWYVQSWCGDHWSCDDATVEPGDLVGEPLADPASADPR